MNVCPPGPLVRGGGGLDRVCPLPAGRHRHAGQAPQDAGLQAAGARAGGARRVFAFRLQQGDLGWQAACWRCARACSLWHLRTPPLLITSLHMRSPPRDVATRCPCAPSWSARRCCTWLSRRWTRSRQSTAGKKRRNCDSATAWHGTRGGAKRASERAEPAGSACHSRLLLPPCRGVQAARTRERS